MKLNWLDTMPGERCKRCGAPATAATSTGKDGRADRVALCKVHSAELEREEAAKQRG